MAIQPYTGASSSSMVSSLKEYDVFISFRGEDTRKKFTSYLYDALSKKVRTFIDENELEKGDEISSTLIKSIEEAYLSVVIFSEDYASSKWCLNELVKILECKKEQGQIVIPVFYEVDPSDVRNQRGSYEQAFEKHEQDLKYNKDQLQKWRNALTEAANLSGWHYKNDRTESNFIKDVVEDVLKKLKHKVPIEVNKEIVGIQKKYEEIELFLKNGSSDVRTFGLWGMGGIGKTTLAKYAYAKLSFQFERRCLLENVREKSNKFGLSAVHKLCLSELGVNFRTKSKEVWESELEKLKEIPNRTIQDVLRLSFDDLDRTQQDIFLDIACFFGSMASNIHYSHKGYLTDILEACKFFAVSGIDVLQMKKMKMNISKFFAKFPASLIIRQQRLHKTKALQMKMKMNISKLIFPQKKKMT